MCRRIGQRDIDERTDQREVTRVEIRGQPPRIVRWESLPLPLPFPSLPTPVVQSHTPQWIQWDRVPWGEDTPLWRDDFANLLAAWKKRGE